MRSEALLAALLAGAALADPLVGPQVGNADALIAEGSKLYNQKQYARAADQFLKATRANPAALPAILQLARAHVAARQITRACYEYRAYLKAAADSPDRKKAQAESDLCERQAKAAKGQPPDPGPKFVETRAGFYSALEKKLLLGTASASEAVKGLVDGGFVGPELGEMANRLREAAIASGDDLHRRALAGEKLDAAELKKGRPLYALASDLGAPVDDAAAKAAYLDGLAEFGAGAFDKAEALFADAAKADPARKEYRYHRAIALYRGGDAKRALDAMEADLPDDPRTAVLRVALALGESGDKGAAELERLLFARRYPAK